MDQNEVLSLFAAAPRRAKPIYYLLTGKRTVSNLYVGLQYGLLQRLQLYPNLKESQFQAQVQALVHDELLQKVTDGTYQQTETGCQFLADHPVYTFRYFDGPRMGHLNDFQERLFLVIQVISEYRHHERRYFPLQTHLRNQDAVKRWFRQVKQTPHFSDQFVAELTAYLQALPAELATVIANRWVGYQTTGASLEQIAAATAQTAGQLFLQQVDAEAFLWDQVHHHPQQWPVLAQLWPQTDSALSGSTQITVDLFKKGVPFAQIGKQRGLKASTINEHLLEAAILSPHFPFQFFLQTSQIKRYDQVTGGNRAGNYQQLLDADRSAAFFTVRLYQIWILRGRPDA
ncbi:hypothetical protein IV38_GL000323 [Lactobacillus selangorensis]|uniref:Helicase Helix-turn-helix domain-containing protein n=1 Tax=Lactobacillus selangorensis TaxID=81857 RepID=A0A0R2G0G6_9LACO|nr:helix-turn-helix domain-containing protein [Lactobacillus selangorensis]KRN29439.1 hypothetical protein IV38_GL000323 [Lactobacillus selangorensis]KRN34032.1 hypothetical protein IV40_GL000345 [Lactobacillus selangorensis]